MLIPNFFGYGFSYGRYGIAIAFVVILFFLVIIGTIVLYFTFLSKNNENRYSGFPGFMYNFLSFRKLILEPILKIMYLLSAACITVSGIVILFQSPLAGLLLLIFGNLAVRVSYELLLMLVLICKNTTDISRRMGNDLNIPQFSEDFNVPHGRHQGRPHNNNDPAYGGYHYGYGQNRENQQYDPTYYGNYASPQNPPEGNKPSTSDILFTAPGDPGKTSSSNENSNVPGDAATGQPDEKGEIGTVFEKQATENNSVKMCPSCGTSLSSDSVYCYNCGKKI